MTIHQQYLSPEKVALTADLLVCRQVLEHIEQPVPFLQNFTRVSQRNGTWWSSSRFRTRCVRCATWMSGP
jgi:2-polyprenyl-3-methyl-5-hydroxy-6-metoxy-1,4-benzoquinol methylase